MTKILMWTGAPWYRRSYAKTSYSIAKRLRDAGYEVAFFAFCGLQWGETVYDGFRVFPNNVDDYGQAMLPFWYNIYQPQFILQHFDAWVLGGAAVKLSNLPVIWMSPVDHKPLPPPLKSALERARENIAVTRFAEESFREAGLKSTYIPHGFDPKVYYPGDRAEARRRMGLPEAGFIMCCVGTNKGPRKNLGNILRAYRDFLQEVPEAREDSLMFLHTYAKKDNLNPQGYDLVGMWHELGIAHKIKYTEPFFYLNIGFTEEEMADLYRSCSYLISVPLGEGFNLPAIESLACGIPVIYSDFSATPEVVGPGGLSVEPAEYVPFDLSSSWQAIPSNRQITERMVEAYEDWRQGGSLARELGEKGRQHVTENYSWDRVMPAWFDYFEKLRMKSRDGIQLGSGDEKAK